MVWFTLNLNQNNLYFNPYGAIIFRTSGTTRILTPDPSDQFFTSTASLPREYRAEEVGAKLIKKKSRTQVMT